MYRSITVHRVPTPVRHSYGIDRLGHMLTCCESDARFLGILSFLFQDDGWDRAQRDTRITRPKSIAIQGSLLDTHLAALANSPEPSIPRKPCQAVLAV